MPSYHISYRQFTVLELNSSFDLVFESPSVTDYVLLESMYTNMSAVTITFWMKTSDKKNYGTPLSYATSTHDNALTIVDYNG